MQKIPDFQKFWKDIVTLNLLRNPNLHTISGLLHFVNILELLPKIIFIIFNILIILSMNELFCQCYYFHNEFWSIHIISAKVGTLQ